ncbi:MAG: UbiA family prenyltransferase [Flavobacteriales bacterium]
MTYLFKQMLMKSASIIKILFLIATVSLVGSGQLFAQTYSFSNIITAQFVALCGTWLLYGFDWRKPFQKGWQGVFLILGVLLNLMSIWFLSTFQHAIIGLIALLSMLYQIELPFLKLRFQLKKFLLVKNVLIGLSWAALIPLGSGQFEALEIQFLFWFMAVQVGYGSIIRDITDLDHDRKQQLQTLPLMLGVSKTIWILQFINLSSFLLAYYFAKQTQLQWIYVLAFVVLAYKSFLLYKVKQDQHAKRWTQYLNISTCLLNFVLTFLLT